MLGVVISEADEASVHIGEHLLDIAEWTTGEDVDTDPDAGGGTVHRTDGVELRHFADLHLDIDGISAVFDDVDCLVFASRHAGETGNLLTAHHTGNFGAAEYGGESGTLARACPHAHSAVVQALATHAPDDYDVGMECTHHGPTDVGVPSMFLEVGSAEPQWADPDAAAAVARAILDLRGVAPDAPPEGDSRKHLVGFGGGHYTPRFERVVRETDWAVGHIAADWCLDALDDWAQSDAQREAVIERAFSASAADVALLEDDRPALRETIEGLGHRVVGETFVQVTSGVPLPLVGTLENALVTVEAGLRFGEAASDQEGDWARVDLPSDLLAEARGIDDEAVRDLVESGTIAFVTEQQGTVVTGPLVCQQADDRVRLVDGLADILRERYDSVTREGDTLVATETAFDPERARTAGIPEGPKFGRLAAGEPVEVDGEQIGPERFQRERIRRFTL